MKVTHRQQILLFSIGCVSIRRSDAFVPYSRPVGRVCLAGSKLEPQTNLSRELVSLILEDRRDDEAKERIAAFVEELTAATVEFNPKECLDGPLFFSTVVSGPPPLWERLGLDFAVKNIQGQQYVYNDDEKRVINYAEVLGSAIHVRAYGTYESDSSRAQPVESKGSGMMRLPNPFSRTDSPLLKCPMDFVVTVDRACVSFFGNQLSIPISGTGYLRVLYADPNVRIFVSKIPHNIYICSWSFSNSQLV